MPLLPYLWDYFVQPIPTNVEQHFGLGLDPKDIQLLPDDTHLIQFPAGYLRNWTTRGAEEDVGSAVKLTENTFTIKLDVKQFQDGDLKVEVGNDNTITVQGRHAEKEDKHGRVTREFGRCYSMPSNCDITNVEAILYPEGLLFIRVPRETRATSLPWMVPVNPPPEKPKATITAPADQVQKVTIWPQPKKVLYLKKAPEPRTKPSEAFMVVGTERHIKGGFVEKTGVAVDRSAFKPSGQPFTEVVEPSTSGSRDKESEEEIIAIGSSEESEYITEEEESEEEEEESEEEEEEGSKRLQKQKEESERARQKSEEVKSPKGKGKGKKSLEEKGEHKKSPKEERETKKSPDDKHEGKKSIKEKGAVIESHEKARAEKIEERKGEDTRKTEGRSEKKKGIHEIYAIKESGEEEKKDSETQATESGEKTKESLKIKLIRETAKEKSKDVKTLESEETAGEGTSKQGDEEKKERVVHKTKKQKHRKHKK